MNLAGGKGLAGTEVMDRHASRTEKRRIDLIEVVVVVGKNFDEGTSMIFRATTGRPFDRGGRLFVFAVHPKRDRCAVEHGIIGSADAFDRFPSAGGWRERRGSGGRNDAANIKLQFVQLVECCFNASGDDLDAASNRSARRDGKRQLRGCDGTLLGDECDCGVGREFVRLKDSEAAVGAWVFEFQFEQHGFATTQQTHWAAAHGEEVIGLDGPAGILAAETAQQRIVGGNGDGVFDGESFGRAGHDGDFRQRAHAGFGERETRAK